MRTETRFEDGDLIVERTYAAPRADVFEAWIETSRVQAWWGCGQTKSVRSTVEPRAGGRYEHVMQVEGAGEIPMRGTITLYEPPARLAFELSAPFPTPDGRPMRVSVSFTEVPGGTRVRLVQSGLPEPFRAPVTGGWTAGFDRLARHLAEPTAVLR